MKKIHFLSLAVILLLSSCVSQKKFDLLQGQYDAAKTELTDVKAKVIECQVQKINLKPSCCFRRQNKF